MSAHSEFPDYGTIKYRESVSDEDEKGTILSWSHMKQVQTGTYKIDDFDFKRPQTSLLGSGTKSRSHANASFEIYDYPGNYADEEAGDYGNTYGQLRIDELQAQHDIVLGQSDCPGLACGSKFTLDGHPNQDENAEYLIIGITYRCTAEAYKGGSPGRRARKTVPVRLCRHSDQRQRLPSGADHPKTAHSRAANRHCRWQSRRGDSHRRIWPHQSPVPLGSLQSRQRELSVLGPSFAGMGRKRLGLNFYAAHWAGSHRRIS